MYIIFSINLTNAYPAPNLVQEDNCPGLDRGERKEEAPCVKIHIHGRGGQGAVLAGRILATALVLEGKFVVAVKSRIWIAVCVYLIVAIAMTRLNLPALPHLLLK
jgi:hypothetical protein